MINNIKPKEATSIINSIGGVVPKIGVQHIAVDVEEINAVVSALEDVKNGHSMVKF
jgi:4-hydroxyphenylpyruvate dioxygenase-like putative hemolysin